jgi:SAM-dependent methyltransferase
MTTSVTPGGPLIGTAAESFERFRLGYPDEVVDRTLSFAGRTVTRAVEIGAGTGKAARAFASRGVHVTALEPDADMFAVLKRETVGMQVEPVARELVLPQREYVGYLSTVSDYIRLTPDHRQDVLRRLAELPPAQVRVDLSVRLSLARRA